MNPLAGIFSRIFGGQLPPNVPRAAGSGPYGASVYAVNQQLIGFGAAINFQTSITPVNGGRIVVLGAISAQASQQGAVTACKLRRNGMLLPDVNVPAIVLNDSGVATGVPGHHATGVLFALDTPQPAGVPVTYAITMASLTTQTTLASPPGQMMVLLLEWGNGT